MNDPDRAATPATIGLENDVPHQYPQLPPRVVVKMLCPGAARSTKDPRVDQDVSVSFESVADTMIIGPPRVFNALDSSGVLTIFATPQASRVWSSVRRWSVWYRLKIRVASIAIGLFR